VFNAGSEVAGRKIVSFVLFYKMIFEHIVLFVFNFSMPYKATRFINQIHKIFSRLLKMDICYLVLARALFLPCCRLTRK